MKSIGQLLEERKKKGKNLYVTREYQDFGYRLAMELGDPAHKSLYIRLAKNEDRKLLERARAFVIDSGARSKGALFMWKLQELKKETKMKRE